MSSKTHNLGGRSIDCIRVQHYPDGATSPDDHSFNTMKKLNVLIVVAAAVIAGIALKPAHAQQQSQKHEVLMLWCDLDGTNIITPSGLSKYIGSGAHVVDSSSSSGAPRVANDGSVEIAQAIADGLNQGFSVQHIQTSQTLLGIMMVK